MSSRTRSIRYWVNLAVFTLAISVIATGIGVIWLAHRQAMAFVHPARSYASGTPDDWGIEDWEEVEIATGDGLRLRGWYVPPGEGADGATLIYIHGLGSNRSELISQAAFLADFGFGALLIDLRGHGDSEGELTTLGYKEVADVQGAIEFLETRPETNPSRIGIIGHSMGAIVAIRAGAELPQLKVVIAENGITSISDNIDQGIRKLVGLPSFPFGPLMVWFGEQEADASIHDVQPVQDIQAISPRAVMLIHGALDEIVLLENGERLFESAEEPKELYVVPNAGHGGLLEASPEEYERRVVSFLEMHLLAEEP
jgi:pimeloyl-ACP methyl ester carboxylesterase